MAYKKLKAYKYTEEELRKIWSLEYCEQIIKTFDNIEVQFYSSMFDHCFFESVNRREKDKSILSLNRLEKIYWIKDALLDTSSLLKKGWNRNTKSYTDSSRVNLVKDNYIVVIKLLNSNKARFITAYEVNNEENLEKIKNSPDWK